MLEVFSIDKTAFGVYNVIYKISFRKSSLRSGVRTTEERHEDI